MADRRPFTLAAGEWAVSSLVAGIVTWWVFDAVYVVPHCDDACYAVLEARITAAERALGARVPVGECK